MGGRGAEFKPVSSSGSTAAGTGGMTYEEFMAQHEDERGYTIRLKDGERQALKDRGLNDHLFQLYMDENDGYAAPDVMTDKEFDAYVKANGLQVIHRGVADAYGINAKEIHEAFMKDGPYYIGYGIYGNGTYFGTKQQTAIDYAFQDYGDGATIRAALKKDAKVIDYRALTDMMDADGIDHSYDQDKASIYARSKGYDAITRNRGDEGQYINVINRGALVVSSKITKRKYQDS